MPRLIKLAFRNILRNKRRTILTGSIILVSFVILSIFKGYITSTKVGWGEILIHNDYGHIQIFNQDYFKEDDTSYDYMVSSKHYEKLKKILSKLPEVEFFSPRVNISGLIGGEDTSKIFIGSARDASEKEGLYYFDLAKEGQLFSTEMPYSIVIGKKLAEKLKVSLGKDVLLMSHSKLGSMEAINATVVGLANNYSGLDSMIVYLNLSDVKDLVLTDDYHYVVVLLKDTKQMGSVKENLNAIFKEKNIPLLAKDFKEIATFYMQVVGMYNNYFNISIIVLAVIIIFSLTNTIYMSITDRLKEYSTMKTIGIKNSTIFLSIIWESILITLSILVLGMLISFILHEVINKLGLTLPPPPGSDSRIPFNVMYDLFTNIQICLTFLIVSIGASIIPAYHVVKSSILKGFSNL